MNYETVLKTHNLKITPQRLGILSLIYKFGHLSIDDLYIHVKKQFSSISLATLYKNINAMLKTRIVTEVKIPNMKSKYEITKTDHAHPLCTQCNEFKDIFIDTNTLINNAKDQSNYQIKHTDIVFSGLCEKCK